MPHRSRVGSLLLLAALVVVSAPAQAFAQASSPWLYVVRADPNTTTPRSPELLVINPTTQHVIATVALPGATTTLANGLAITADARTAYVGTSAGVVVVNLVTHTVTRTIVVGGAVNALGLAEGANRIFAARRDANVVDVVDLTSQTMTGSVAVTLPVDLTVTQDGARLLIASAATTPRVYEYAIGSGVLDAGFVVGLRPVQVLTHQAGNRLYVLHDRDSFGTDQDVESVAAYDLTTKAAVGSVELPRLTSVHMPFYMYLGQLGRATVTADGARVLVPHFSEGWRTSPTSFGHGETIRVIETVGMTLQSTVQTPTESIWGGTPGTVRAGPPMVSVAPGDGSVFGASPKSAFSVNSSAGTSAAAGPGLTFLRAVSATAPHACAFEVWPQRLYVREAGAALSIPLAVPAGCAWTAVSSEPWLSITSAASGTGPATLTLQAQGGTTPRAATISVGGMTVTVTQAIATLTVESPANGQGLTLPLTLSGWAIDRDNSDPAVGANDNVGIDQIQVFDTPAGGTPVLVATTQATGYRADVRTTYGARYYNAGFSLRLSRLAPGAHTLTIQARSRYDGTLTTVTREITIARSPIIALDLTDPPMTVTQPYRMRGWAVDLTATSGTGIDAVQITMQRAGDAAVALTVTTGLERPELMSGYGLTGSFPAGFAAYVSGLPPGLYTVTARARSIASGAFDAVASGHLNIAAQAPFGVFDTPSQNATNLEGAIAVTGWALDDVAVDRVEIWRSCVEAIDRARGICRSVTAGAPPDDVYVGQAVFLPGARPDVQTIHPNHPNADRAGWGLSVLSNALPHIPNNTTEGGQGTFTLKAYAVDTASTYTLLGQKTVTLNNAGATRPFGTLDTPMQGETVPGAAFPYNEPHAYPVFGWALTQAGKCIDTTSATAYRVYVDGVQLSRTPGTNWFPGLSRPDIAAAYPGLCNSNNAVAAFYLDLRTLANGLHTIGWDVLDDGGQTAGIGSRFFNVQLPSADAEAPAPRTEFVNDRAVVHDRQMRATIESRDTAVAITADEHAVYRLRMPQLGRLALDLGGAVQAAYQRVGDTLVALPIGSTLEADAGRFYWQPPIAFLGTFSLVFVTDNGRIETAITIVERATDGSVSVTISSPRAGANPNPIITVTGSARDPEALTGTGIDTVHVWARRLDGPGVQGSKGPEVQFLGKAELSVDAYTLTSRPLAPGTYQIEVYAWVARTGTWAPAATVIIAVR